MHDIYLILGSIQSLKQEVVLLICATTKLEGAVIKWKLGRIYSGLLAIVTTHTVIIIYTEYFGNESSKSSHNQI